MWTPYQCGSRLLTITTAAVPRGRQLSLQLGNLGLVELVRFIVWCPKKFTSSSDM